MKRSALLAAGLIAALLAATAAIASDDAPPAKPDGPDLTDEPDLSAVLAAGRAAPSSQPFPGVTYRTFALPAFGLTVYGWTFDQGRYTARVAEQKAPKGSLVGDFIGSGVLAINGGFFEREKETGVLSPSGLLVIGGKEVAPENDRAGSGIVHAGANGVAIDYRKSLPDHSGMTDAIQVGPVLVDPGGKVGVLDKQHDRHKRSAVCVRPGTFSIVAVDGGLSLFQFANVLAAAPDKGGFGCDVALNLDGGPSTQVLFKGTAGTVKIDGAPVENALVVSANPN